MKPGVPFDVLLNKDSKRKIQSSVGWKNTDRLFGGDAFNLVRALQLFNSKPNCLNVGFIEHIGFPFSI